jgi:hypothetical protein
MIALITHGRKIKFTTFQPPTKHKSEPKAHAILPTGSVSKKSTQNRGTQSKVSTKNSLRRAPVELPSDNIGTKMYAEIYCLP